MTRLPRPRRYPYRPIVRASPLLRFVIKADASRAIAAFRRLG